MLAIWHPFWYEADQPISVGQVSDFQFFKTPPQYVQDCGHSVFYHGDWKKETISKQAYKQRLRILSINHPELGRIQSIDTKGLNYTVTMSDGPIVKIEAEEQPGTVFFIRTEGETRWHYDDSWKLVDWRFYVEAEIV